MDVTPIENKQSLRSFINVPYRKYRHDKQWVPPLRSEVWAQYDRKKNPFLNHCTYQLFLLMDHGKAVGRIAAFIDDTANQYWNENIGLFGYYECPPNHSASKLLLSTAQDWLRGQGVQKMRGPWSFVSQEWGSVVEGFTPQPVIMAPYNPPYYNQHFSGFGLKKIKDLIVYEIDARQGYQIPDRIMRFTYQIAERYQVHTRHIRMKAFEAEVNTFLKISNICLAHNWGYAPVSDSEATAMAHDLKQVLHEKAVIFAENSTGEVIGFGIALPDINRIIKKSRGRLLPFGWLRLLVGLPRLSDYRMFALGVIPQYHGKGIDSLIYRALYESCFSPSMRMEINYILEDNAPMINAIIKLGAKPIRRYRIYQKDLPA